LGECAGRGAIRESHFLKVVFLERSLGRGGAQRQLVALATGLADRGHDVTIALFYDEGEMISSQLTSRVALRFLGKRSRRDALGFFLNVIRSFYEEKPDVICTFLPVPNLVALGCKLFRPSLRVACGIRASNVDLQRYDRLTRFSYRMEALVLGMADVVISNSVAGKNVAMGKGIAGKKILVIPNGIDVDRFDYDSDGRRKLRELWGVAGHEMLVGIVGRLDPMKGHQIFLRAAGRVGARRRRDVRFLVVGDDGPVSRGELISLAVSLGLGDRMIWSGGRDDVAAVLSACDVVCSSSVYGEGFSNILAEAMACGRRCVATDVGDARTILGQAGYIVPPGDDEALASSIESALDDVHRAGDHHFEARARIEQRFSLPVMVSAFENEFRRLSI
jgi:glycosyltransferase involved in cell wall biosynthesis